MFQLSSFVTNTLEINLNFTQNYKELICTPNKFAQSTIARDTRLHFVIHPRRWPVKPRKDRRNETAECASSATMTRRCSETSVKRASCETLDSVFAVASSPVNDHRDAVNSRARCLHDRCHAGGRANFLSPSIMLCHANRIDGRSFARR